MNVDISFRFFPNLTSCFIDTLALDKPQATISKENAEEAENGSKSMSINAKRGMVLPFTPLTMSFDNVNYYVDMPKVTPNPKSLLQ